MSKHIVGFAISIDKPSDIESIARRLRPRARRMVASMRREGTPDRLIWAEERIARREYIRLHEPIRGQWWAESYWTAADRVMAELLPGTAGVADA
jgi:hypothetical protein